MPIILAFVLAPAILASLDSIIRAALFVRSRSAGGAFRGGHPRRWLVIVPARAEGARLRESMRSIAAAMRGRDDVTALLLLDGEDAEASAAARENGFATRVKTPAGPTKAAALAWLAREERALVESADAILIIDAGSRVDLDFFDAFVWPEDADAVQTHLRGVEDRQSCLSGQAGLPVPHALAVSENFAQTREDRGREAFGWNVRLRGTGTAFRPQTFLDVIPRLVTRIEDHEASLLLTAAGATIRLAPEQAIVYDEKPSTVDAAALQRARWLLGRYELLGRRAGTFAEIIARNPAEGVAALVEIFGRPLSLSVPLRLLAGAWAIRSGAPILGGAVAATTAIDIVAHGVPRGTAGVAASWLLALAYAPRALTRWLRTER
jgi:cellulose synthase/poly-beta-1,6-N-acetylglucosamine synthase-like glycosyltransferase